MKAWELLSDKAKHTTGTFARDKDGKDVSPRSPEAVCWCALGAIYYCDSTDSEEARRKLRQAPQVKVFHGDIPDWNDHVPFEEVVAVLKELDL